MKLTTPDHPLTPDQPVLRSSARIPSRISTMTNSIHPRVIVILGGAVPPEADALPHQVDIITLGSSPGAMRPEDLAGWLLACVRPFDRVVLGIDPDHIPAHAIEAVFHRGAFHLLDEVHLRLPAQPGFRPDVQRLRTLLDRWAGPALIDGDLRIYAAA